MKKDYTPKLAEELVGTKQTFSGGLFSISKSPPEAEYSVLKWRWGSAYIMNMKNYKEKHPTVEFLLKKPGMKRAQWTRGFAVRELVPNNKKDGEIWMLEEIKEEVES